MKRKTPHHGQNALCQTVSSGLVSHLSILSVDSPASRKDAPSIQRCRQSHINTSRPGVLKRCSAPQRDVPQQASKSFCVITAWTLSCQRACLDGQHGCIFSRRNAMTCPKRCPPARTRQHPVKAPPDNRCRVINQLIACSAEPPSIKISDRREMRKLGVSSSCGRQNAGVHRTPMPV